MKEIKTMHKHKCGCVVEILTLNYKPLKKDIQDDCPKCTLSKLLNGEPVKIKEH